MRLDAIDAMIAELRAIHPELRQPLTWLGMSAILDREGIALLTLPLVHDAQVISCDGVSVMAINSNAPPARHTYFAAHEYAHIKLHFRDVGEIVYHTSACWPDDPREDDAEYMATSLLMGPQRYAVSAASTIETIATVKQIGDDAPIVQARRRARLPNASVEQPSLPLSGHSPEDSMDPIVSLIRRHSPRSRARWIARDRADKSERDVALDLRPRVELVTENRERKHYFVDRDGNRWRIYDLVPPGRKSRSLRLHRTEPPNNWASERAFVAANGEHRHYEFAFREPHELEARFLEKQLAKATRR